MNEKNFRITDIISLLSNVKNTEERNTFIKTQLKKIDEEISENILIDNIRRTQAITNRLRNYELFSLKKVLISQLDLNKDYID